VLDLDQSDEMEEMNETLRIAVDASGTVTSSNILMDADHPVTTACAQ
jgi:hypothetical protein